MVTDYWQRFWLQPSRVVVQSESIWPAQVGVDQNLSVRSIQVRSLDLCNVTPVCPEQEAAESRFYQWEHSLDLFHLYAHVYIFGVSKHICNFAIVIPFAWEHCDGSGFIQTVVDQDFAARSIKTSHLNGVAPSVGPVHVPGHPVHGQSICGLQALADDGLHATAVQICTPRKIKEKMNLLIRRFTWERLIGYFFTVSVRIGVCVCVCKPYDIQGDVSVVKFSVHAVIV